MKLSIKLKNCFGISKLEHVFDFKDKLNSVLIYAPNGTMKSSFAKTMLYLSKQNLPESKRPQKPCDLLDDTKTVTYKVKFDGIDIPFENIYVMNGDDEIKDSSEKISTMLASSDLKQEYDRIYQSLDAERKEFIRILKDVSQSSDCEDELVNAFKRYESDNLFTVLNRIKNNIQQPCTNYGFRYNFVFDKKGNVKKFLDKHQSLLTNYINCYNNLISQSDFFSNDRRGSFGTYQAEQIINALGGDGFFHAHHKLSLSRQSGIIEITSKEQFETIYNQELEKIATDNDLKKSLKKLDKAIGANEELRDFKNTITQNPHLIPYLNDYEKFRKEAWYGYLHSILDKVTSLMDSYELKKIELLEIRRKAKEEINTWKEIIKLYNDRFFVPFEAELKNQDDVILKRKTPVVRFKYQNNNNSYEKDDILKVLSKGEQRALFILQFLFEIECRKKRADNQLIILDDISDSFDYKNKYAIIEYIKDINEKYSNLKIIILTHNYDFYRTVHSRLTPKPITYMTVKNDNNEIKLEQGQYVGTVFTNVLIPGINTQNDAMFVSIIPWVRNIVEYTQEYESDDYMKLTSCLHIKSDTCTMLVKDVYQIITNNVKQCDTTLSYAANNTPIKDFIFQVANVLESTSELDEIALENKTVFAMAIRLKLEENIISKLTESQRNSISKGNQTAKFITALKKYNKTEYDRMKSIIEKVNMMTPENIHVNSFMFEPLIDLSVVHLKKLYTEVKAL